MSRQNVPINKGNYSMDTEERDLLFEKYKAEGWEKEYKEYRFKWIFNAKNKIVSDYPLLVDIELSSICNLKCPMCYTISDEFKKFVNTKRMDYEIYKKIIDEIAFKVPAIRLSLRGESTLHPKFAECIKYAKDNGIKEVSTLTHGFKLTIPYFKKIAEAGIDWITISIDGVDETYNSIRKPLKFSDLLNKIKEIKKYKSENNIKKPVIKVQGIWPAIKKNVKKYYDTFSPLVDQVAFNPLVDVLDKSRKTEFDMSFSCPQQYQRLTIGADGLVMKCANDENNKEIVGDINRQTVHEIWHGEKMQRIREMHKEKAGFMKSDVCKSCHLPLKTYDEYTKIDNRKILVKNYVGVKQEVGESEF